MLFECAELLTMPLHRCAICLRDATLSINNRLTPIQPTHTTPAGSACWMSAMRCSTWALWTMWRRFSMQGASPTPQGARWVLWDSSGCLSATGGIWNGLLHVWVVWKAPSI